MPRQGAHRRHRRRYDAAPRQGAAHQGRALAAHPRGICVRITLFVRLQDLDPSPLQVRAIAAPIRQCNYAGSLSAFDGQGQRGTLRHRASRRMESSVHLLAEDRALGLLRHGHIHRDAVRHSVAHGVDATCKHGWRRRQHHQRHQCDEALHGVPTLVTTLGGIVRVLPCCRSHRRADCLCHRSATTTPLRVHSRFCGDQGFPSGSFAMA